MVKMSMILNFTYCNGFFPCMTLTKKKIIAITKSICINDPSTWKPKKPISQSTMRIIAIVVNIL